MCREGRGCIMVRPHKNPPERPLLRLGMGTYQPWFWFAQHFPHHLDVLISTGLYIIVKLQQPSTCTKQGHIMLGVALIHISEESKRTKKVIAFYTQIILYALELLLIPDAPTTGSSTTKGWAAARTFLRSCFLAQSCRQHSILMFVVRSILKCFFFSFSEQVI